MTKIKSKRATLTDEQLEDLTVTW